MNPRRTEKQDNAFILDISITTTPTNNNNMTEIL